MESWLLHVGCIPVTPKIAYLGISTYLRVERVDLLLWNGETGKKMKLGMKLKLSCISFSRVRDPLYALLYNIHDVKTF